MNKLENEPKEDKNMNLPDMLVDSSSLRFLMDLNIKENMVQNSSPDNYQKRICLSRLKVR